MADWMNTGWDALDTAWDNVFPSSKMPRRVWMPPGATQRFMFLDDTPESLWEHNYKWNNSWLNYEPCVVRNSIDSRCPICNAYDDKYPYFIGLFTVISMTPWFTKKTNEEVNYTRQMFGAKLGSEDKPGVLKKLRKIAEKNGGKLRGYVYDIERPGKKTESCGSEFELVEVVDGSKIKSYAMDKLSEYANRINESAPADKRITVEKLWEKSPWEALDIKSLIKESRHSVEELTRMFAKGGGATIDRDGDFGGGSSGAMQENGLDDDIPY